VKMSDSSGIATLDEVAISGHQVEVRLLFESKDYTLAQLAQRIQDVESLIELILHAKKVLNPRPPMSGRQRNALIQVIEKGTTSAIRSRAVPSSVRTGVVGARRYFKNSSGRFTTTVYARSATKVRVETVSLHSPLEIVLIITGGTAAAILPLMKLVPLMIKVKNQWNESRVTRAKANLEVEKLKLEMGVVKLCAEEIEKIDVATYFGLPEDHPSKMIVKGGVRALSNLDKAEVKKT
jgi:hypothetical protein